MSRTVHSPLDLIGDTPLAELMGLTPNPEVRIYGKLEWFNPCGSSKDRPARQMILDALAGGRLRRGMRVIEATSGNTGTALAFVCQVLGFPLTLVVPRITSARKLEDMRRFGAEVLEVEGDTTELALERTYEMVDREPDRYFHTDQFTNPSNARAHELTTGPEILRDCPEVTDVVASEASFGTIGGIGSFFVRQKPEVRIHAVVALPGSHIPGMRPMDRAAACRGPALRDQLGSVLTSRRIADGADAVNAIQRGLALGYHLGGTAALVLDTALGIAREIGRGSIVCVFADSGSKYAGNPLYDFARAKAMSVDELRHQAFTSM
jgi:cysteine synthase B